MRLKYAIRGISKNILYTILLLAQLVFAYNVIYENLSLNKKVSLESQKIRSFFAGKKFNTLEIVGSLDEFDKDINAKMTDKNIEKVIKFLDGSTNYKLVQSTEFALPLQKFDEYMEFKANDYEFEEDSTKLFSAKNYIISNNFFDTYSIEIKKGRKFNENEYKAGYGDKNTLPIIIGADYEKYFNVGDELTYYMPERGLCKAKIIGVIRDNQYFVGDIMSIDKKYINLNNYILTTSALDTSNKMMIFKKLIGNYLLIDEKTSDAEVDSVVDELKRVFQENLNIKVGVRNLDGYIKSELNAYKEQEKIVFITALTIIIFVSITLLISLIDSIMRRKREFGIHILNGGTLRDIAIVTYMEVFLVLFSAFIISIPFILRRHIHLDFGLLILMFIILVNLSVLISILPIIKILKLSIIDLIKGDE